MALIVRGLLDIVRVFVDRAELLDKIVWSFLGVLGLIAGILILYQPVAGGAAFVWIVGLYSIILGTLGMVSALALREGVDPNPNETLNTYTSDDTKSSTAVPIKSRRRTT
jgi:uncharacterized membrane protein HdeD (DUF308 family)